MDVDDRFLSTLVDHLDEGIVFLDKDRKIRYWNSGARRISGIRGDDVIGKACRETALMHVDEDGAELCASDCPVAAALADGSIREVQVYVNQAGGRRVPVSVRVVPVRDSSGEIIGAIEILADMSEATASRKRIDELVELVLLDPLTRIPNRNYMDMFLQTRVAEMQRYGSRFGVLFFDIDKFKAVNDTYGHETGDEVLKSLAATLTRCARMLDLVARWGGEEFAALVSYVDEDQLIAVAERIRVHISEREIPTDSGPIKVTVSIGATVTRPDDTAESIMKRADELMYKSKAAGRNRVTVG